MRFVLCADGRMMLSSLPIRVPAVVPIRSRLSSARSALPLRRKSSRMDSSATRIGLSAGGGAAIKYKVGDAWCDWKAPGPDLVPGIVAELSRLAWFSDGAFPKDGTIDVAFSGLRLQWRIRMESTDAECILTPIQE